MKKYPLLCAALLISGNAFASDLFKSGVQESNVKNKLRMTASLSSTFISVRVPGRGHGGIISVVGPEGYSSQYRFLGSVATVNLMESKSLNAMGSGNLPSGRYYYEVTTHIGPLKLVTDTINNGRGEDNFTYAGTPFTDSGSFVVKSGGIQQFEKIQEPEPVEW